MVELVRSNLGTSFPLFHGKHTTVLHVQCMYVDRASLAIPECSSCALLNAALHLQCVSVQRVHHLDTAGWSRLSPAAYQVRGNVSLDQELCGLATLIIRGNYVSTQHLASTQTITSHGTLPQQTQLG